MKHASTRCCVTSAPPTTTRCMAGRRRPMWRGQFGSVQERVDEHAVGPPTAGNGQTTTRRTATTYRARWHRRVREVMTKTVVTVDRITPYKEIASLMAEHK